MKWDEFIRSTETSPGQYKNLEKMPWVKPGYISQGEYDTPNTFQYNWLDPNDDNYFFNAYDDNGEARTTRNVRDRRFMDPMMLLPFAAAAGGAMLAGAGGGAGAGAAGASGAGGAAGTSAAGAGLGESALGMGLDGIAGDLASTYAVGGAGAGTAAGGAGMLGGLSMSDWINGIGTVGSIFASNKAAGAMGDASDQASATQLAMYNQSRADMEPWRQTGMNALTRLADMKDFTGQDLTNEPGYQFGLNEGMKGINRLASASGSLNSGATAKALTRFATDYAGTKYNDAFSRDATNKNRLASLAGVGQTAAAQIGNNAMQTGQIVGNNTTAAGTARGAGYVGSANALNSGVSNWYNSNQQNRLFDLLTR